MKALCWHGTEAVRVDTVPDPKIMDPLGAVVDTTLTAICGSYLHHYDGFMPTMEKGDILGHEPLGEVVEVSSAVKNLKPGDRVVVPFAIACGTCFFCEEGLFSLCNTSNPNPEVARKAMGQPPAGLFGYSYLLGGFAGGQAEYLRIPFAESLESLSKTSGPPGCSARRPENISRSDPSTRASTSTGRSIKRPYTA